VLANVDTNQTRVFRETSREATLQLIPLSAIAGGMGLVAWLLSDQPIFFRIAAAAVAFFLGAVAAVEAVRLLKGKYRILTLAPKGFQDTNIAPQFVPWSAVQSVTVAQTSFRGKQRIVAIELKIKDCAWSGLSLSRSARLNKYHSGMMWVMHVGNELDFQSFLNILQSYARAHGGKVE
jgi:hypothetical protein